MDFRIETNGNQLIAVAGDGHSAYNVELIVKPDHEPSEGDRTATMVAVFGRRLPNPE